MLLLGRNMVFVTLRQRTHTVQVIFFADQTISMHMVKYIGKYVTMLSHDGFCTDRSRFIR